MKLIKPKDLLRNRMIEPNSIPQYNTKFQWDIFISSREMDIMEIKKVIKMAKKKRLQYLYARFIYTISDIRELKKFIKDKWPTKKSNK